MPIHIVASSEDFARTVVLFSDSVRTRSLAKKFLDDCREISNIGGACFYTGEYKGTKFTFGTSGLGSGSMGIYAYELFHFYGIKRIIKIGTAGAYSPSLSIGDLALVKESVSDCGTISEMNLGIAKNVLEPSRDLLEAIQMAADKLSYKLNPVRSHSTDIFYPRQNFESISRQTETDCTEMDSFSLFANALRTERQAAYIAVITDTLTSNSLNTMSPEEMENCCDKPVEIVLNLVV